MPRSTKNNIVDNILQESLSQEQTSSRVNNQEYSNTNKNKKNILVAILGLAIIVVLLFGLFLYKDFLDKNRQPNKKNNIISNKENNKNFGVSQIKKFTSEEEFKEYLTNAPQSSYYGFGASVSLDAVTETASFAPDAGLATNEVGFVPDTGLGSTEKTSYSSVDRVSQTNTQVLNIDEPDIVKTDGKYIYFSSNNSYDGPVTMEDTVIGGENSETMRRRYTSDIKIIKALPIEDLELISRIERAGEMFLYNKILVIFEGKEIYGYDISNIKSPEQKWNIALDKSRIVQSRMYNDKIYLVTVNSINEFSPCPIVPLSISGRKMSVMCSEIYYPETPVSTDSTFIAMKINPQDGNVEDKISFIGSANNSVVYMSENNLYVTYYYSNDIIKFYYNFIIEDATDLFPETVVKKLKELMGYNITQESKMQEFGKAFQDYISSLSNDEQLKIENEMQNRMKDYYNKHRRELEQTGIVKIALDKFSISSAGSVPGRTLNQFALDEYNNNLRIATTIGDSSAFSDGESLNDVYILDNNLNITGSVKDLGKTERIYSVRFLGNRGYVVTFRQTDPFYVLDLSNPKNPQLKGELKIPGFSSYLHPLSDDIILGIGRESSKVKISMFDVSDPSNPQEVDKYMLDEYWTEIQNNHRAFLIDKDNKLFFIPGSRGAYIFNYTSNKLTLGRAVSEIGVKRSIYINDYLYIIGDRGISVISEKNLEDVKKLDF